MKMPHFQHTNLTTFIPKYWNDLITPTICNRQFQFVHWNRQFMQMMAQKCLIAPKAKAITTTNPSNVRERIKTIKKNLFVFPFSKLQSHSVFFAVCRKKNSLWMLYLNNGHASLVFSFVPYKRWKKNETSMTQNIGN